MNRIAVFPGSFNPITLGHYEIVKKSIPLFDEIIIAVGTNESKNYMFDKAQRFALASKAFENLPTVSVKHLTGLTADFCKMHKARFILRGLRNTIDFEYEKSIAEMNNKLNQELETIFLISDANHSCISSSIIRELIKNKLNVEQFLPPHVSL